MTLKATVLPLSQIDTTLVDVRLYERLLKEAGKIKNQFTRAAVLYVIDVAYENANDTVFAEHARDVHEWAAMFYGTLCGFIPDYRSGSPKTDRLAKAWFARRGIRG